jgi:hypothetical protein
MGRLNAKLKDFVETELLKELMERNCYGLGAPREVKFLSPHNCVIVGIGKDHGASIYIDVDVIDALREYKQSK